MYGSLMDSLMQSQRNLQNLQKQIASGDKYASLADNPSAITQALKLQTTLNANDKYQQNTTNAVTMLRYAYSAMNNVLDAAQSIRSLIIQAGDGSLDSSQLKDITAQIEANKKIMLDNLNARVAGKYIFGGTDTSTPPFVEKSDGSIIYQGTDERIKYALSESLLGDISFTGSDIVPENDDSYFICSHNVPLDWVWTGREEKVQITVGNRTLSVFIPEDWSDNDTAKPNPTDNYTDYNRFRDPNEVSGISLDDLATIVNRSLEEQGADMLVKVSVEKDTQSGTQQLIMKSNTGEKIGITGWPDTDYMPMPASITSREFDAADESWKSGISASEETPHAVMGSTNLLSWKGGSNSGTLTIKVGDKSEDIDLTGIKSSTDLVKAINDKFDSLADGTPFASFSDGNLKGRLVLRSATEINVSGTGDAMKELFGADTSLKSTSASITVKVGEDSTNTSRIYINAEDTLSTLAERINAIEGVYSRTSGDGSSLTVIAQRIGDLPSDRLANNDASEEAHYPALTITGYGEAANLFSFPDGETAIKATSERRQLDHSHIDIFDALGMETAMKTRELGMDETLSVDDNTELHWRIISGGHSTDIKLNPGSYTLQELRDRIQNAGSGWLEATLEVDSTESSLSTNDGEAKTQRLVLRGYNGEQVLFLDMNQYNYADQLGLSTALRTDAYTEGYTGTGTKCVNFPSAPCVDDNVGIPMRVQMNCGMYYDVNIKRSEVIDAKTGFVDRTKVMQSIVDQVNKQEGHDIMGCTVHVDKTGKALDDSASIYFLSGEAFTVVDMPFDDPEWNDYSGGLAAQMGIHGGITSNLKMTTIAMKDTKTGGADDYTFANAYRNYDGSEFEGATIHLENLGHEVDIDISPSDTVKDVMDRIRSQAGSWLYVNYYDEHMGQIDARNAGDYPIISISSVDGSAVSVFDMKGHVAEDVLGISTGVNTRLVGTKKADGLPNTEGIMDDVFLWNPDNPDDIPATELTITVAGYSHTIDLTEMRNITGDDAHTNEIRADDLAEFINARMQDYDVRAAVNSDKELVIWSKRGYAVDVEFTKSQEVTGMIEPRDYGADLKSAVISWGSDSTELPAEKLTITLAGTEHVIDLSELSDGTNSVSAKDVAGLITKKLQTSGITASVDDSGEKINITSKNGNIDLKLTSSEDVTAKFLGDEPSSRSYYRGGYNLEGRAETRGIEAGDMYSVGMHGQNATIRSGANTMRQNGFGVINDVIAAIEAGNRDDLTDKMLPKIDDFISNILSVMSENGALQNRYEYNNERLTQESSIMTENYDEIAKIDPADAISQLMVADYMYQANLAIISRLIQPSLLDFIS